MASVRNDNLGAWEVEKERTWVKDNWNSVGECENPEAMEAPAAAPAMASFSLPMTTDYTRSANPSRPDNRSTTLSIRPKNRSLLMHDAHGSLEFGIWGNVSRPFWPAAARKSDHFIYPPLNRHRREIRLIEILPEVTIQSDSVSGAVSCRMKTVALDEAPEFWALSYAWGDASKRKTVFVDFYPVEVSESLEAFLQELRRQRFGYVQLWADAACINQEDNEEKGWQVGMMKKIYERAAKVVCWLGEGDAKSDRAMDTLNDVGRRIMFWPEQNDVMAWVEHTRKDREEGSPFPIPEVPDLLGRAWWGRTWCLQELVSAHKFDFACGRKWLHGLVGEKALCAFRDWRAAQLLDAVAEEMPESTLKLHFCDDLSRQATMFGTWYDLHKVSQNLKSVNGALQSTLDVKAVQSRLPLAGLLCRLSVNGAEASDPRDAVFALLGLACDAEELEIRPDYGKTCKAIYEDLASAFLTKQKTVRLLHACQFPKRQPNLPTWVPDWSSRLHNTFGGTDLEAQVTGATYFSTSKDSIPTRIEIRREGERLILALDGMEMEKVREVGEAARHSRKLAEYKPEERTKDGIKADLAQSADSVRQWIQQLKDMDTRYAVEHQVGPFNNLCIWQTVMAGFEAREQPTEPKAHMEQLKGLFDTESANENNLSNISFRRLCQRAADQISNRVPFNTKKSGFMGNGPAETRAGDVIAAFHGLDVPIILHPVDNGFFEVVGGAYINGAMAGERFDGESGSRIFDLC